MSTNKKWWRIVLDEFFDAMFKTIGWIAGIVVFFSLVYWVVGGLDWNKEAYEFGTITRSFVNGFRGE
jgi:hypothetical protein